MDGKRACGLFDTDKNTEGSDMGIYAVYGSADDLSSNIYCFWIL